MKIAILGTGGVGRALGAGFLKHGHEVVMGSRSANHPGANAWAAQAGAKASVAVFSDAAAQADIVVLAVLGSAAVAVVDLAGPDNLAGKVLIDATNPLVFGEGSAGPKLAVGFEDSGGEQIQRRAPSANVVKAFNTVGNRHMVDPDFVGGPPDMFICGNSDEAKAVVSGFLKAFGWGVLDIGGIEGSRILEPMAILWIAYGLRTGTWDHAFKLLRK